MDADLNCSPCAPPALSPPPLIVFDERQVHSTDLTDIPERTHPLAVPVVSETRENSRPDAKAITETRLTRLRQLSSKPEEFLSEDQLNEKRRIIRLEKNRRAAAMSRRKKKVYIKNLEERATAMAKHMAVLEMDNNRLRVMVTKLAEELGIAVPHVQSAVLPPLPIAKIEPDSGDEQEPPRKRRKLNPPDEMFLDQKEESPLKSEPPPLVPLEISESSSTSQSQPPEFAKENELLANLFPFSLLTDGFQPLSFPVFPPGLPPVDEASLNMLLADPTADLQLPILDEFTLPPEVDFDGCSETNDPEPIQPIVLNMNDLESGGLTPLEIFCLWDLV